MAGILSIYGLITALVITSSSQGYNYGIPLNIAYSHFSAGLSTGISALASGITIGISGQAITKYVAQQPSLFTVMLIIMIFGEALALFGLIVSLIVTSAAHND